MSSTPKTPASPPLLDALAIQYEVKGQGMPQGATLRERLVFARGLGMAELPAAALSKQDRACSLANALGSLIAQSGDPLLAQDAARLIHAWNRECESFFEIK